MDRLFVIEKLRESYRNNDPRTMRRQLATGSWFLTEEDKRKVQKAIDELELRKAKPLHPLIKEALRVLGGRIISND